MKNITLNELKLFTAIYTMEHDNLSKKDKFEILEFIKDANEHEINYLLETGEVKKGVISEVAVHQGLGKVIVSLSQGEVTVGAALAASAILWLAYKKARSAFSPRECKDLKVGSSGHRMCTLKGKIAKEQGALGVITSKRSLCNKSKDPNKCVQKLSNRVAQIKAKIQKLQAKQKMLAGK